MANEEVLGPRKTMFVLVIVVGCFAVLWPRILSPLMLGPSRDQIKPNQLDREAGCCEVIFETEVAVLELLNEVCSLAVGGVTGVGYGKLPSHTVTECRRAVNETCGMDIAAFLTRTDNVGKTTKVLLDTMKNSNSSCLKEHFGVPIWSLSIHPAVNSWAVQNKLKQERSPIRGMGAHPALRERGRAIPPGAPTPPSRGPIPMPPHARPPPIPGMRPPLGAGAGPAPAPRSSMGFVMPIYTICIIVFFVYTLSKILFKRTSAPYEELTPDPHFRRRVFRDHARTSPDTLGPKERDARDIELEALKARLEETERAMQRIVGQLASRDAEAQDNHTRPVTNGTVLNNSPVQIITSEYREPSREKSPEPVQNNELETKEASPEPDKPSTETKKPSPKSKELSPEPKEPTPVSSNSTPENKEILSEIQDSNEEQRRPNKDLSITEKLEQTESYSVVVNEDNQVPKVKEFLPESKESSRKPEELILESEESVLELKDFSPEPEKNIAYEEPTTEPGINSEIVESGKLVDINEQNIHTLETKEVSSKNSNETEISQQISEPRDVISETVEVNVENIESNVLNQEVRLLSSESKEILDVGKDNVAKSTEDLLDEARMVTMEELSQQEKLSTPELLEEAIKEEFIIEDDRDENVREQENASVKVVGMEVTAHAADGGAWPRDPGTTATSAAPATSATPHRPHEAEEVTSIFLQTEIPHQSRVLVADSHSHSNSHPPSSPLVVSGKVTLSLIQDAPRDAYTPDREPESTVDEFTTASALTQPAEREELQSDEEFEEEIEIEEIEEEEEEEEPQKQKK